MMLCDFARTSQSGAHTTQHSTKPSTLFLSSRRRTNAASHLRQRRYQDTSLSRPCASTEGHYDAFSICQASVAAKHENSIPTSFGGLVGLLVRELLWLQMLRELDFLAHLHRLLK
eukprot:scaffold417_cov252-Pinguiococcus_pyrenoidosus.AAC.32